MPKRRTRNQLAGDCGETQFKHWAETVMEWNADKPTDLGIDFVCQIKGKPINELSCEMPGHLLGVSVRSTNLKGRSVLIYKSDAELFLSATTPIVLALVKRSVHGQSGGLVAIKIPDEKWIAELYQFVKSTNKTKSISFNDAITDPSLIQSEVEQLVSNWYALHVYLSLVVHELSRHLDDAEVEYVVRSSGKQINITSEHVSYVADISTYPAIQSALDGLWKMQAPLSITVSPKTSVGADASQQSLTKQDSSRSRVVSPGGDNTERDAYNSAVVIFQEVLQKQQPPGHFQLTKQQIEQLNQALEMLDDILNVTRNDTPNTPIHESTLRLAFHIHHLLSNRTAAAEILNLWLMCQPVPLDAVRGVISGYVPPPDGFSGRIRNDHPNDLDAGILACVVESELLGQFDIAFRNAQKLVELASTSDQKVALSRLFIQLWGALGKEASDRCSQILGDLLEHDETRKGWLQADLLIRKGDAEAADQILEANKVEDDQYWIQLKSYALLKMNKLSEAAELLLQSAKSTMNPVLLSKARDVAYQAKELSAAIWCCEQLLQVAPSSAVQQHTNLAQIYAFELKDTAKAATEFRVLHELEPDKPVHTYNLAVSLANMFEHEESLTLYDELCSVDEPTLQAVVGRAQLLHNLGQPERALASLQKYVDAFHDNPQFLMAFMAIAHAAGDDTQADDAIKRLHDMQTKGAVDPNMFQMLPQEQIIDLFAKKKEEEAQRNTRLHNEMHKGRMPWIWAEQTENRAIYLGWRIRTQPFDWINDDPLNRARLSIYSTNGLHPCVFDDCPVELLPLRCSSRGEAVVADLSALITLHRLGLLGAAAEYFGEIQIPLQYLETVLEDCRQMMPHQRSSVDHAASIDRLLKIGSISVLDNQSPETGDLPIVDEYLEKDEHRYRLIDLITPPYEAGHIDDSRYKRIAKDCHKPSGVDDKHPCLKRFQPLVIDLTTLESLTARGALEPLVKFFQVFIHGFARDQIDKTLQHAAWLKETQDWQLDLWHTIRNDKRFRFVKCNTPDNLRKTDRADKEYLPFLATFLSTENNLPLLADDRVCQAYVMNYDSDQPLISFGTDTLIRTLHECSFLDDGKAMDSIRQLMAWRYRFIQPSSELLKALADNYRKHPPGIVFRFLAEYVHDCMRDRGLFAGRENTQYGENMALKLYMGWMNMVVEFLILVWADEEWPADSVKALTIWACEELLPSYPLVLEGVARAKMSELTPRLLITRALLASNNHSEPRLADAMKAFQEALHLSDIEYSKIFIGVLDDTARTARS